MVFCQKEHVSLRVLGDNLALTPYSRVFGSSLVRDLGIPHDELMTVLLRPVEVLMVARPKMCFSVVRKIFLGIRGPCDFGECKEVIAFFG